MQGGNMGSLNLANDIQFANYEFLLWIPECNINTDEGNKFFRQILEELEIHFLK